MIRYTGSVKRGIVLLVVPRAYSRVEVRASQCSELGAASYWTPFCVCCGVFFLLAWCLSRMLWIYESSYLGRFYCIGFLSLWMSVIVDFLSKHYCFSYSSESLVSWPIVDWGFRDGNSVLDSGVARVMLCLPDVWEILIAVFSQRLHLVARKWSLLGSLEE